MASATHDMFDLIDGSIYPAVGGAQALHNNMHLHSVFQPIYSLSHCRIVGYEGLLRVSVGDGEMLSPYQAFASVQNEWEVVYLDRLSRALHMRNFCDHDPQSTWLFLNVDPQVIVQGKHYGSFFAELLDHYQMPASRVVVEIIEGAIADEAILSASVQLYKDMGCLVAIDDFGAGHSNFERIWQLVPDIVKLDRSIIVQALNNPAPRRVLPGIISLIHAVGSLVLIEGVETADEAMIAMDTGVDLVQGYYFGGPSAQLRRDCRSHEISQLFGRYKESVLEDRQLRRLRPYSLAFGTAVDSLQSGVTMQQACLPLLRLTGADRCYLLDQDGVQMEASLIAASHLGVEDARYQPLAEATGANWFRRPYFRRALQNPGELQITRPYLSIATGRLCVTLSQAMEVAGQVQVLCYDIDWDAANFKH